MAARKKDPKMDMETAKKVIRGRAKPLQGSSSVKVKGVSVPLKRGKDSAEVKGVSDARKRAAKYGTVTGSSQVRTPRGEFETIVVKTPIKSKSGVPGVVTESKFIRRGMPDKRKTTVSYQKRSSGTKKK